MNYQEFKQTYTLLFNLMMKYNPGQSGAGHYAEKMTDLSNQYPEFAEQAELECY
jgi:hypothetical protein